MQEKETHKLSYIAVRTKDDVDSVVAYFKAHKEQMTPLADKWIRQCIIKDYLCDYYREQMLKVYYPYKRISRMGRNISLTKLSTKSVKKIFVLKKKMEEFRDNGNSDRTMSLKNVALKGKTSFEILEKKEWNLDWNCVLFRKGSLVIYARSDMGLKFKPVTVYEERSVESFNYLKKYLNERLPPIRCIIVRMQLTIVDEINFDSAIMQFSIAARQQAVIAASDGTQGRITATRMSFSQALSKAKQMTPEDFKKYKSEYIDFLVNLQSKKYKVIPCVERLSHSNNDITEYAFMFSIKCNSNDILIVYENVNPDRSTLLFVVKEMHYDKAIQGIYDFLQSAEINKRSSLREGNLELRQIGIDRYNSINHDGIYYWQRVIKNYKLYWGISRTGL